jgi:hypothetical protein
LARYYQTPAAKLPPAQTPNDLQNKRLQKLLAEGNPDILEAEVRNNIVLLDQLQTHIIGPAAQSTEAQQWLQQIESLKQQNVNEPTVIGVVGNTGAGKSSVINAMLDEERLVPVSCLRACSWFRRLCMFLFVLCLALTCIQGDCRLLHVAREIAGQGLSVYK